MTRRETILLIEAIVFMAPAALFLLWAIPMMSMASMYMIVISESQTGATAGQRLAEMLIIGGGVLAFFVLGRLTFTTIRGKEFHFGWLFWLSLLLGCVSSYYLYLYIGLVGASIIVIPLFFVAAHFSILQARIRAYG